VTKLTLLSKSKWIKQTLFCQDEIVSSTASKGFHRLLTLYDFVLVFIFTLVLRLTLPLWQFQISRHNSVFCLTISTFAVRTSSKSKNLILWSEAKSMVTTTNYFNNSVLLQSFNSLRYFLRLSVTVTKLSLIVLGCRRSPTICISVLVKSYTVMFPTAYFYNDNTRKTADKFRLVIVRAWYLDKRSILKQTQGSVVVTSHHFYLHQQRQNFESCERFRIRVLGKFSMQLWPC